MVWDFDSELQPEEAVADAKAKLEKIHLQFGIADARMVIRIDPLKEKVQKVRLGEFELSDVIPYITKDDVKRTYEYKGAKHAVKMNSHRYFLFRESMKCASCGLAGTKMILEHHPADKSPHFNLYGVEDGKLVLMTKDHIFAKSCGGEDRHSNYQVMCIICNNLKGHANLTLDSVCRLRHLYNENKNKTTKKKLHLMLEEMKQELSTAWGERKPKKLKSSADAVIATHDINIWQSGAEFVGRSVYDQLELGYKHVGCVKKGTYLEPMLVIKNQVVCSLTGDYVMVIPQNLVRPKK
jgi:5-methylcytosine-specific restriction endonuclease McrA